MDITVDLYCRLLGSNTMFSMYFACVCVFINSGDKGGTPNLVPRAMPVRKRSLAAISSKEIEFFLRCDWLNVNQQF